MESDSKKLRFKQIAAQDEASFARHHTECTKNSLCLCCETVKFPSVWNELRQRQELCDGVIQLPSGSQIKIHRVILSAASSYFTASFTYNNSTERLDETLINVDVPDHIMHAILDYAYTGSCDVDWSNVEELLAGADRYDVVGLLGLCCQFLRGELKADNCIGIYFIADVSQELDEIDAEDLYDILSDEHLNAPSEEIVFEVIRKWVEFQLPERLIYLPKLLPAVRFGLIGYQSFREKFMSWPPVKDSPECQRVILPLSSRSRIPYELIMVVGGWTNGSPTDIIECYDTRANIWLRMRFTDSKRAYHGICTIDHKVYVLGGSDGVTHFNSMRCYDPVKYKWEEKACMYQPRCYVSVVVLDRKIYALGGYNGHTRLNSVERYDPDRNQWKMVAPMLRFRSDAGAATLGDHIYVVGGFNGNEALNSCEMYNPATNSWTLISLMQSPRSGVALVAHNDYLYALGGLSGDHRLNSVERYSPKNLTWTYVAEMMCPRSNFASAVIGDTIYAIGGYNGTNTISFVECYDLQNDTWQPTGWMNVDRCDQSACVLQALPNAKGYSLHCKEITDAPCVLKRICDQQLDLTEEDASEFYEIAEFNVAWEHGALEPFFD